MQYEEERKKSLLPKVVARDHYMGSPATTGLKRLLHVLSKEHNVCVCVC